MRVRATVTVELPDHAGDYSVAASLLLSTLSDDGEFDAAQFRSLARQWARRVSGRADRAEEQQLRRLVLESAGVAVDPLPGVTS